MVPPRFTQHISSRAATLNYNIFLFAITKIIDDIGEKWQDFSYDLPIKMIRGINKQIIWPSVLSMEELLIKCEYIQCFINVVVSVDVLPINFKRQLINIIWTFLHKLLSTNFMQTGKISEQFQKTVYKLWTWCFPSWWETRPAFDDEYCINLLKRCHIWQFRNKEKFLHVRKIPKDTMIRCPYGENLILTYC